MFRLALVKNHVRKRRDLNLSNAAFTLKGFDDQERKLTVLKTDFPVLKLRFNAYSKKQAFYPLYKLNIVRADNTKILLYKFSVRVLVVTPACVNAA